MPQPAFVAAGAGVASTTSSVAIPYPAGIVSGYLLVAHLVTRGTPSGISLPSGWALWDSYLSSNSGWVIWKVADGTESGSLSVTFTGGTFSRGQFGRMYSVQNTHLTSPFESLAHANGSSTTVADQSVTSTGADRLAANLVALNTSQGIGPFSGMTGGTWAEAVSEFSSLTGQQVTLQIQTATLASAVTINGGTTSLSTTSGYTVFGFAIKPPPATLVSAGEATETDVAFPVGITRTPPGLHPTMGETTETDQAFAVTVHVTPPADNDLYFGVDFGAGFEDLARLSDATANSNRVGTATVIRGRSTNLDTIQAGQVQTLFRNGADASGNDGALLDPSNADSRLYGKVLPGLPIRVARIRNGVTYEVFTGPVERWEPQWVPPNYQDMGMEGSDSFRTLSKNAIVSEKSTFTTNLSGSNNDLTFTARDAGGQGDDIRVEYVVAGSGTTAVLTADTNTPLQGNAITTVQWPSLKTGGGYTRPGGGGHPVGSGDPPPALTADISGSDITVNVATDGAGNATSTASQVLAALVANPDVTALVDVALATGNTGAGTVTALTQTNLSGGKWPEEASGVRINRILDLIGWPADQRAIDTGQSHVIAQGFSVKDNVSALAHITDVADAELGYIFMSGGDVMTFHDGAHRQTSERSATSQATFSDDGTGFSYTAISPSFDADRIINSASVSSGAQNAQPQIYDDLYSQFGTGSAPANATNIPPGGFRKNDIVRQTLLSNDADALAQATAIVTALAYPLYRFDSITTLEPGSSGTNTYYGEGTYDSESYGATSSSVVSAWIQAVMPLEIGDLITVRTTPPGTSTTTQFEAFVEGIEDFVQPGSPWSRTLRLSASSQAVTGGGGGGGGGGTGGDMLNDHGSTLILDDPTEGTIS